MAPDRRGPGRNPPQQLTCVISADLRPGDRQALLELFDRSSSETRRERFHGSLSVFPQSAG